MLDRVLQLRLGAAQFFLEAGEHSVLFNAVGVDDLLFRGLLGLVEQHQHEVGAGVHIEHRAHRDIDVERPLAALHDNPAGFNTLAALNGLEHRRAQLEPQLGLHQRDQVARGLAGGMAQELVDTFRQVHDIRIMIDQRAGRRVFGQQPLVHRCIRKNHLVGLGRVGRCQVWHRRHYQRNWRGRTGKPRRRLGAVQAVLLIDRHEKLGQRIGRFGAAQEQVAARLQGEMEHFKQLRVGVAVQVDQQVAAADQVEPRERRIAQHVLAGEQDGVAQCFTDAVAAVLARKVLGQPGLAHVVGNAGGVQAGTRHRDGALVDVGAEQLELVAEVGAVGMFGQ